MTQRRRPSRGFTLIEVMIALFILALMAAMAWRGVDLVIRSRDSAQAHTDAFLRVHAALGQWEADLHQTVQTQVVPAFNFDGASLRLTRSRPEGVEVVVWSVRGNTLVRWAAPPVTLASELQEAWMRSYQLQGDESNTLQAVPGVSRQQLYVYYSSSSAWSNAQSTGDSDASQPAVALLPDGVRWVLSFSGSAYAGELQRTLQLVHP
jgi:general secretion pathway protein J